MKPEIGAVIRSTDKPKDSRESNIQMALFSAKSTQRKSVGKHFPAISVRVSTARKYVLAQAKAFKRKFSSDPKANKGLRNNVSITMFCQKGFDNVE